MFSAPGAALKIGEAPDTTWALSTVNSINHGAAANMLPVCNVCEEPISRTKMTHDQSRQAAIWL
jgi:hypothetical protein